jgi:hypothetical protein
MGNVVALGPSVADGGQPPRHRRLQTRSRMLAHAVTVLIGGLLLFSGVILALGALSHEALSMGPDATYLGDSPPGLPGVVPFGSLPLPTRLAYAATLVLDTAPVLFALVNLRALLRLYAAGVVFAAENGARIKRVALGLVAFALAPFLGHELVVLAGDGVDMAWFHASEAQALVLGAVLFVIAQVMEVGREIEQDRDGFV